eukprot:TRINITY_DN4105_c0_g1_i7.p1 TRINITY_DN4105_c0_g1~~TRINITY_DN4105_c0_g1_i7.p1  ORF type:complete len:131 (-),score=21.27 TRINITY_DN4105_c0_g1_i7:85-477(-)
MTQEPQKLDPLQPRYVDKQISLVDEKLIRDRTGDLEKSINDQVQVLGEEANEYLHTRCEELKNLVRTVDQSDAMVKRMKKELPLFSITSCLSERNDVIQCRKAGKSTDCQRCREDFEACVRSAEFPSFVE